MDKKYFSYSKLLLLLVLGLFISCSSKSDRMPEPVGMPNDTSASFEGGLGNPPPGPPPVGEGENEEFESSTLDSYLVKLGGDEIINIPGVRGTLIVWIGDPKNFGEGVFSDNMVQTERTIPAIGKSAKVKPFSTAFDFKPKVSGCRKIHESGSIVRFELIPKRKVSGEFNVNADVNLYYSADCSGVPVSKGSKTLTIRVKVNNTKAFIEEAQVVFWDKLLGFWKIFVGIIFALILFLIRKRLKQWFGFDNQRIEPGG